MPTAQAVASIACLAVLVLVCLLVWLIARRIRRWAHRSLKAREDLARGIADVAERLEKIEQDIKKVADQK